MSDLDQYDSLMEEKVKGSEDLKKEYEQKIKSIQGRQVLCSSFRALICI